MSSSVKNFVGFTINISQILEILLHSPLWSTDVFLQRSRRLLWVQSCQFSSDDLPGNKLLWCVHLMINKMISGECWDSWWLHQEEPRVQTAHQWWVRVPVWCRLSGKYSLLIGWHNFILISDWLISNWFIWDTYILFFEWLLISDWLTLIYADLWLVDTNI